MCFRLGLSNPRLSAYIWFDNDGNIVMDHEKLATRVENVSMATGIVAGIAAAGATIAAPTGLAAVGVWLGISSAPLIVTAAPILGTIATVAGTISGGTYFYARWKSRQQRIRQSPALNGVRQDDEAGS